MLLLDEEHRRAIVDHAEATYPEECCGILIGRLQGERRRVFRLVPAANSHAERRDERYAIAPEALLLAHKQARTGGLEVIGYYHSHPDHAAEPSGCDARHAWPEASYLITAVTAGRCVAQRSWRLDGEGRFAEEQLVVGAEDDVR